MAKEIFTTQRDHRPSWNRLFDDQASVDIERRLRRFGRVKRFEAASTLFGNGTGVFFFGVIIDGVVAARGLRRDGNNPILQFFGPHDIISLAIARNREIEFEILTPATIRCLDQAQLKAAIRSAPELATTLLTAAASQLQGCLDQIAFMRGRAIDRLGYFLLRAIYRPFDLDRTVVSIKRNSIAVVTINRTALAAHIGTTTTNLAHLLLALQEEGIIRALTPRRFEVLEETRLAASWEHLGQGENQTTDR
ncbi:Crp/Fnr family transcriptional regulator [Ensifer sp. HO-A22]|uniref:Crp/Fnr family transcriptional regulator n=1 Tax=Ensifer oleiphilus TaxID=2742698 RepID=A0A7Y6QC10_9HYPH|nr:Crp/Fnr family transcriptional regulator [Ensifer oleiphilus]NVD42814.1 Crp/Fnr family transcriptional regulator [Ensifer oleiphilus]